MHCEFQHFLPLPYVAVPLGFFIKAYRCLRDSLVIRYNNKTSYYFDRELGTCKQIDFPVGILTPDWLANATYLGTDSVDTYDTHVWTKSEGFIKYWADVKTGLPVRFSSPLLLRFKIKKNCKGTPPLA